MVFKAFVLCASALLVQTTLCQFCAGPLAARPALAYDGLAYDGLAGWPASRLGCSAIAPAIDIAAASSLNAAYGGGLPITSASAIAPTGLAVTSENAYEGAVAVVGNLPFLGTVAMEGLFPTAGAGAVSYGCGDGIVAITAEGPIAGPAPIAPAMAPLGLTAAAPFGYATGSCGCSGPYLY